MTAAFSYICRGIEGVFYGLVTNKLAASEIDCDARALNGVVESVTSSDVPKLVKVCRYIKRPPAISFVQGLGLERGANGNTNAHESHEIIAVGTDGDYIIAAINGVAERQGGLGV